MDRYDRIEIVRRFSNVWYFLGLGKVQQADRLHINPYDGSKVQYLDPITSFPEKMDELLVALNKVCERLFAKILILDLFVDLYGYETS